MITGIPIDNGDGSYTFSTDLGEPVTLRGDAAQAAFQSYKAAPVDAAPPPAAPPDAALYAPAAEGMQQQAPVAASAALPFDPAAIAGFNRQDQAAELADVRQRTAAALGMNAHAAPPAPLPSGKSTAELSAALDRPLPTKPATGGGPKGAVFYEPPKRAAAPAPAGPARPSGPVPVQQTLQGTMPLSEADEAANVRAAQGQYEAAEKVTAAEGQRAREEAGVRADAVEADRQAAVDMQAREAERQRSVAAKMAKIDQLADEAAAGKVDPDHYWADKSAEVKFGMAALVGLSVYASGRGGGPAYALQQMNGAIDRDMHAQEANLQNKREALHSQINLLGQLRQEYGDREAAQSAFRAIKTSEMQRRLEEIGARNLPEQQQAKLAEFAAALEKQRVAERTQAGRIAYSRTERFGGVGGPGGPSAKDLLADAKDYGKEIENAKLNEYDASLASAEETLAKYKGKDEVPGVGKENVVTRGVKHAADYLAGEGSGEELYYNKEERGNRQVFNFVKADLKHAITGAGMPESESQRLDTMIDGARKFSDLANVAKIMRTKRARHSADLAGGHTPEAVELYELRRKAALTRARAAPGVNIRPAGEE